MPTPDPLALLDTLDGLHKAATDSTRFHATKRYDFGESAYALWPELSTALRTALTTTDGEREVREALAEFDARDRSHDIENDGAVCVSCHVSLRLRDECDWPDDGDVLCDGCTDRDRRAYVDHLRTALNLLATERAKAADAARERAAIVAWLRSERTNSVCDIRKTADAIERGAHTKVTP